MKTSKAISQLELLKKYGREERLAADEWKEPWQTLIAILLSARTRDEVTIKTAERLFEKYDTLEKVAFAKKEDVENKLKSVNYYRNKTKNVLACANALLVEFKGKVPQDIEALITLPGVGRKTANVFLSSIGKEAIGVDTHVGRIAYKLRWTTHKNPAKIEEDLKKLFPQSRWNEVNETLVKFGRNNRGKKENEILKTIGHTLP